MGKEKRVENQQILGILRTKKHGVIFQVEICETDMDLTTKSWQQRVLNSQKDHQFLPWARNHPKNALRVFYFDLFCECWGVKIRFQFLTCFFLYHISWLVFDLFQSRMLVDHLPILESNFPGRQRFPQDARDWPPISSRFTETWEGTILGSPNPSMSICWVIGYPTKIYGIRHITSLNLFSITHFQPVFIGGFAHISAHCSLYSLDVWLVSSLNFPLQITILVINNPNSCISFKSPFVLF